MILSFHPIIVADQNIICAGREPDSTDLEAIKKSDAVILPQGCPPTLYKMASSNCPNVFPNYQARFQYPGKIGQSKLFESYGLSHPKTKTFESLKDFYNQIPQINRVQKFNSFKYPFVFKFNWGGEGDNVLLIQSQNDFTRALKLTSSYENTGQFGFLIQELIQAENRSLRVVVIKNERIAYWRINTDPEQFGTSISKGAKIDYNYSLEKQADGIRMVDLLCRKTGIDLAGIDLIFSASADDANPLFLEINYFFGRDGLGGSEKYYELLNKAVDQWIKSLCL